MTNGRGRAQRRAPATQVETPGVSGDRSAAGDLEGCFFGVGWILAGWRAFSVEWRVSGTGAELDLRPTLAAQKKFQICS